MLEDKPKRPRGRPPMEGDHEPLHLKLPKFHYDYLSYLVRHGRLARSVNDAAIHILVRELDAMFSSGYHEKKLPSE